MWPPASSHRKRNGGDGDEKSETIRAGDCKYVLIEVIYSCFDKGCPTKS